MNTNCEASRYVVCSIVSLSQVQNVLLSTLFSKDTLQSMNYSCLKGLARLKSKVLYSLELALDHCVRRSFTKRSKGNKFRVTPTDDNQIQITLVSATCSLRKQHCSFEMQIQQWKRLLKKLTTMFNLSLRNFDRSFSNFLLNNPWLKLSEYNNLFGGSIHLCTLTQK
jgi:hypothetical protein